MKSFLPCAVLLTLSLGALNAAYADSATWRLSPTSGDWNTAANWMPRTVPNGPADIATFSTSSRSTVSLSNVQIEVASLIFDTAATNYTISVGGHNNFGGELTIGHAAFAPGPHVRFMQRPERGQTVPIQQPAEARGCRRTRDRGSAGLR